MMGEACGAAQSSLGIRPMDRKERTDFRAITRMPLRVANTPFSMAERWGLGCGLPMRARKKRQAGKTPAPPETWDERCLELRWTLVPYRHTGAPLVVVGCGNWQRKLASIWSGKLLVAAAM